MQVVLINVLVEAMHLLMLEALRNVSAQLDLEVTRWWASLTEDKRCNKQLAVLLAQHHLFHYPTLDKLLSEWMLANGGNDVAVDLCIAFISQCMLQARYVNVGDISFAIEVAA